MERHFVLVTTAVRDRCPGDTRLAPVFPGGILAMDATTLDKVAKPFRTTGTAHHAGRAPQHPVQCPPPALRRDDPIRLPARNEQVTAPGLIATLPPGAFRGVPVARLALPRGCGSSETCENPKAVK